MQRQATTWKPSEGWSPALSAADPRTAAHLRRLADERRATVQALRGAVSGGQLVLHYQPIVGLADRRLLGVEALVRWNRPGFGLVKPEEFIPVAEQTGLIAGIDAWVLQNACQQSAAWGDGAVAMAVNLSATDLRRPDTTAAVGLALRRTGLPPGSLTLEIAERTLASGDPTVAANATAIHKLGVRFTIDHLGTGHTTFAALRQMPAQLLKIDPAFVSTLDEDEPSAAIVGAFVDMGHALGLTVIAEGVQRISQVDRLRALGCDGAQGRLYARPQPADQLAHALATAAIDAPRHAFRTLDRVSPRR